MSNSPKYTRARLRADRDLWLREARARAAAADRVRRRAEEDRRRIQRIARAQADLQTEVHGVREEALRLLGTDGGTDVAASLIDLSQHLHDLDSKIGLATGLDEIQQVRRELRSLKKDLRGIVLRAQAARRAAGLANAKDALTVLERTLADQDRNRSERFDPGALAQVEGFMSKAAAALRQKGQGRCLHFLGQAQSRLDRHLQEVQSGLDALAEKRDQCQVALAEATDRIASLGTDPTVDRWAREAVRELARKAAAAQALIDVGQFAPVNIAVSALVQEADVLVDRVQERQLQEDRRTYVVRGIVEAMTRLGFVVQAGSPIQEHPADPSSAAIIHARRIRGGAIAVSVPQKGEIWYDVADFPMRCHANSGGQEVRSCDEAEAQIQRMHAVLEEAFGIEMDEVQWAGKSPDKVRKAAQRLPTGEAAPRVRDGGS